MHVLGDVQAHRVLFHSCGILVGDDWHDELLGECRLFIHSSSKVWPIEAGNDEGVVLVKIFLGFSQGQQAFFGER